MTQNYVYRFGGGVSDGRGPDGKELSKALLGGKGAGLAAMAAAGVPVQVVSVPGLFTVFFSEEPVHDYAGAKACDTEAHAAWCRALLARGVFPPASQFEAWFPSLAHTQEHLDRALDAATAAFAELA